jgi:hypothetical protein
LFHVVLVRGHNILDEILKIHLLILNLVVLADAILLPILVISWNENVHALASGGAFEATEMAEFLDVRRPHRQKRIRSWCLLHLGGEHFVLQNVREALTILQHVPTIRVARIIVIGCVTGCIPAYYVTTIHHY